MKTINYITENKNFTKKDSYWLDPAKWLKSKED